MAQVWLEFSIDFGVDPTGGLAMAQGWDETRQSFEAAMFACPQLTLNDGSQIDPDLLYAPKFGAGLGFKVGQNPTGQWLADIQAGANYAAQNAPGVDPTVPPQVTLTSSQHLQQLIVNLTTTTGPQTLSYDVSA